MTGDLRPLRTGAFGSCDPPPVLALGALTMFGYVTSVAARYLHQSLGGPSALAITGLLIIGLAVVSARLMRATHPPKAKQVDAEEPSRV